MSLTPLGPIVRLQIQQTKLKIGDKPNRRYDPAGILSVPEMILTPRGAETRLANGDPFLDQHHMDRADTHNINGTNNLSVSFTSHYAAIRAEFGDQPHLFDGCAGENILIETSQRLTETMLADGVYIQTASAPDPIRLHQVINAPPCRPFSGYILGGTEASVKETLQFLNQGIRGFYCTLAHVSPITLRVGDLALISTGA